MYTELHPFEPLLPADARVAPLLTKAHDLSRLATLLSSTRVPLELRSMNSYHTSRIKGQHTRPHEIEQALRQDFSGDAALAAKQRLAVIHIGAEAALKLRYTGPQGALALCSVDAVQDMHRDIDGNGRVMRLHTHTLLSALGYTAGLWSPLRGFARSTQRYYALGALVKRRLLKPDSPQDKVRFGLPQHALRFLFPQLWPEAEAEA